MSLLDADDEAFDLPVHGLEMDIGADIFRPSANLEDVFKDELDAEMGLDTLSFYEFGPFSPPSSPRLQMQATSFTHAGGVKADLPPKYFKTVRSSPQKRRMISRTLGQIKSFSFEAPPPPKATPAPTFATLSPLSMKSKSKMAIKQEPKEAAPEPSPVPSPAVTPKRQPARSLLSQTPSSTPASALSPAAAPLPVEPAVFVPATPAFVPASPTFVTPVFVKKEVSDEGFSPLDKATTTLPTSWGGGHAVLPPRYLRGPDVEPEKKRAHSTTFGRVSSFSFKQPKQDKSILLQRAHSLQ
ncbi:hypothetical protein ACHHYP_16221 [Achlya hypogyna]|uniref:Uncharacterized protein n=1 Tax=Achlya hypogyna TaxID=1202772 RepID=A0A1V9Y9B2_ACHHY|nr:hypothetical protein ACHHYP_16221 [Achlya hypogyna]